MIKVNKTNRIRKIEKIAWYFLWDAGNTHHFGCQLDFPSHCGLVQEYLSLSLAYSKAYIGLLGLCFISRCDSLDRLKCRCSTLEQEIRDTSRFKDFYNFTFNYAKNPGQKGLGKYTDLFAWFARWSVDAKESEILNSSLIAYCWCWVESQTNLQGNLGPLI